MPNTIQKQIEQKQICKIFQKMVLFKDKLLDYAMQDNEKHIPRKALALHKLAVEQEEKKLMKIYDEKRPIVNGIASAISDYFQNNYFNFTAEQMDQRMSELSALFSRNAEINSFLDIYEKHISKYFESDKKNSTHIPLEVNFNIEIDSKMHASTIMREHFFQLDSLVDQIKSAPKQQNRGPSVLSEIYILFL